MFVTIVTDNICIEATRDSIVFLPATFMLSDFHFYMLLRLYLLYLVTEQYINRTVFSILNRNDKCIFLMTLIEPYMVFLVRW